MKRNVRLEDICDGKLYGSNDMVKVDTHDCDGCSACCHGMGNSIILDPMDIYRLTGGLGKSFGELMQEQIEINVVDGVILPNLKMSEDKDACRFLSDQGRCTIHSIRPGFCRLFPLGRYYTEQGFHYILQNQECQKNNRSKMKVSKWLNTPELKRYESFCLQWHHLQKKAQAIMEGMPVTTMRSINMYLLQKFFMAPYDTEADFYPQFEARLAEVLATLASYEDAKAADTSEQE